MTDIIDDFKSKWGEAKKEEITPAKSATDLIALSQQQVKSTVIIQFKNMIILLITMIGLVTYFFFLYHFQETTSHVGITLMIGGLSLRILIEAFSIIRANRIDISNSANDLNNDYLSYYYYRKRIHGPVTIGILVAYTIGFFLLMPEFNQHMEREMVILIGLSYLPAAAIVGFSIRKGIRDELKLWNEVMRIQKEIGDS